MSAWEDQWLEGAALADQGRTQEAITIFQGLLGSVVGDYFRTLSAINIAVLFGKEDQVDAALEWYDQAAGYERAWGTTSSLEAKAIFLHERARHHQAIAIYEELAARPWTTAAERERYATNLAVIRGEA